MKKNCRLLPALAVLIILLCIYLPSAWAEGSTPEKLVKDFVRPYFMLDSSMAGYLSETAQINEDGVDLVDLYFQTKTAEARDRGYNISFLQQLPIHVKTKVLSMDDATAVVQIDAVTIRSINPLFRMVGYVFGLIGEYDVQDIITLVKENGQWKIGPGAFDMPM